jgi:hypothetical protein
MSACGSAGSMRCRRNADSSTLIVEVLCSALHAQHLDGFQSKTEAGCWEHNAMTCMRSAVDFCRPAVVGRSKPCSQLVCTLIYDIKASYPYNAVDMQSAVSLGLDCGPFQLRQPSHRCQQQSLRRSLPTLVCRTGVAPRILGSIVSYPAGRAQPRQRLHSLANQRPRQHINSAAALQACMVSTTAADAHPDILSIVYDEQQLAESVSELGR